MYSMKLYTVYFKPNFSVKWYIHTEDTIYFSWTWINKIILSVISELKDITSIRQRLEYTGLTYYFSPPHYWRTDPSKYSSLAQWGDNLKMTFHYPQFLSLWWVGKESGTSLKNFKGVNKVCNSYSHNEEYGSPTETLRRQGTNTSVAHDKHCGKLQCGLWVIKDFHIHLKIMNGKGKKKYIPTEQLNTKLKENI